MEVLIQLPGDAGPPIFFDEMNGPRSMGGRFYCDEKTVARDLLKRAGLNVAISLCAAEAFFVADLRRIPVGCGLAV